MSDLDDLEFSFAPTRTGKTHNLRAGRKRLLAKVKAGHAKNRKGSWRAQLVAAKTAKTKQR